jgi:hypothetical protein
VMGIVPAPVIFGLHYLVGNRSYCDAL